MNEAKLKACPFCGCKGILKDTDNKGWWHVECELCGARRADTWLNNNDAVGAWNVRAGDQQPEAKPNDDAIASSLERVVRTLGECPRSQWYAKHGRELRAQGWRLRKAKPNWNATSALIEKVS